MGNQYSVRWLPSGREIVSCMYLVLGHRDQYHILTYHDQYIRNKQKRVSMGNHVIKAYNMAFILLYMARLLMVLGIIPGFFAMIWVTHCVAYT